MAMTHPPSAGAREPRSKARAAAARSGGWHTLPQRNASLCSARDGENHRLLESGKSEGVHANPVRVFMLEKPPARSFSDRASGRAPSGRALLTELPSAKTREKMISCNSSS